MTDLELRDIADGWHLCVVLGLTSPAAAIATESIAGLLALAALTTGHRRPAATLTATTIASAVTAALIH